MLGILGKDDWNKVVIACSQVADKWKKLCTSLGLSFETIQTIKHDNANDSEDCWSEALMRWIQQQYNIAMFSIPSWKSLLRTISRVDQPLFEKLAKEHQVKSMLVHLSTILYHKPLCT